MMKIESVGLAVATALVAVGEAAAVNVDVGILLGTGPKKIAHKCHFAAILPQLAR